ncbi:MAG TPA: MlaD family protein [Thermoanaerobaculia bacterium]|jgi:paraquat-inducible protein B|nr:MlaD family protein [Thermoanaerobaculia bacterium]
MSEYDDVDDRRKHEEPPPEASVHVAKWSPWIWIVPVLAIFFVGFLIVRYGFFGGGDITVRFAEARGLDRYSPVRFRGAKVGTVQKITIDEKLSQVVVRISMDASMNHALRKGTRFWIVEPGLEGGGLGGLLSGTYVGIAPGEGDETREFAGQEYAPVVAAPEAGKTVILEAEGVGALAVGTPVLYQGMRVGRILGAEYDEKRRVTAVHLFVVQRFANDVRQSTRFWRGGGLDISLSGGGLSMGGAGIAGLLNAPVGFYTPEVLAGGPVAEGARFQLYESEAAAIAAADGPHLTYLTYFPGPLRGLKVGTPVQMKGVQVGRVRDVRLRYVPQTATLETPVTLEIDPRRLEFSVTDTTTREDLRANMNDALQKLVQKGMRATLSSSLVLPGASAVGLELVAKPGTGRLVLTSDPPIIPAASADSGIEGAMAAIGDVATTIRNLPLQEIAGNMRSASARLDSLVNDPALDRSLRRLDTSLAELEKVAKTAGENVDPIVESLRNAAESAEAAAKSAQQLVGTSQKQNYDVAELIRELTRAAEAVRALATYLSENPDSLIRGRRE